MMHAVAYSSSDDATSSIGMSSPGSSPAAEGPLYYVESPSSDYTKSPPFYSPSHTHPRSSASSRLSAGYTYTYTTCSSSSSSPSSIVRKFGFYNKTNLKPLRKHRSCSVIREEDEMEQHIHFVLSNNTIRFLAFLAFLFVFFTFSFILWSASRPFKPHIILQGLEIESFYYGQGSDVTGVPTKMMTMNCSLHINVSNPSTFFGIHVTATPVNLFYSQIVVATGQLKYYLSRKSNSTVVVNLLGFKVPLYGSGASLAVSDSSSNNNNNNNGRVPFTLAFDVQFQRNVLGKLVRSRHTRRVSCSLAIDSRTNQPITFDKDSCVYM